MYNNLAVYSYRQVALWFLADLRRWPYLLAFRTSCSHRMLVLTARNDGASMAEEGCGMVVDRGECTDVSSYLLTMTTFGGLQAIVYGDCPLHGFLLLSLGQHRTTPLWDDGKLQRMPSLADDKRYLDLQRRRHETMRFGTTSPGARSPLGDVKVR